MPIEFISGKPRNGKSLFACRLIEDILRTQPNTHIATNLPLKLGRLSEYLQKKYGTDFNCHDRIRILTDEECSEFWLYPYKGVNLDPERKLRVAKRGEVPKMVVDFAGQRAECSLGQKPVTFLIDECHQFFNAREFKSIQDDALHYGSQHGKVGDNIILISQACENVDVAWRRIAQAYHYIKNMRKNSIPVLGGIFKAPALFVRTEYLEPKTGKQIKQAEQTFTLDAEGIASCYETAVGVGVIGQFADKDQARKGLAWWWLLVLLAVGTVVAWRLPGYIMNKVLSSVIHGPSAVVSPIVKTNSAAGGDRANVFIQTFSGAANNSHSPAVVEMPKAPPSFVESKDVFWTTRVKLNGRWLIGLSDGQSFYLPDERVRAISLQAIMVGTNVYRWGNRVAVNENRNTQSGPYVNSRLGPYVAPF